MRAIGYLSGTINAKGESDPATALAQQSDAFLGYCDREAYEPAATFLDTDLRGDRVGFHQLLEYLAPPDKGFVVVVVQSFSHLGADATKAARAFFQIVGRGARVFSIADGAVDEERLLELWREEQPQDRRARVREAMRRRAVRGQALGRPPYGYRVGEDRRLEIVEDEAALVRHIFQLSLQEGLGIRRIVKRLNEEGYRTRRDGNWSMVTVRDLLRNRVYVGTYTRFGVQVPGNHPAIVGEADFQAVQERMDSRRTAPGTAKPGRFLLSGLVYCGESGSRMIGVTRRQRWTRRGGESANNVYRYYQSEARTNQSVGEYHTWRAADLEAAVLGHLRGEGPGVVQPSFATAGDAGAVAAEVAMARSRTETRLRTLDRRLSSSLQSAVDGASSAERLHGDAETIVAEYQHTEDELDALKRRAADHATEEDRRRRRDRQLARVRDDWERLSFEDQQDLLREVVERIVVTAGQVQTVLRP